MSEAIEFYRKNRTSLETSEVISLTYRVGLPEKEYSPSKDRYDWLKMITAQLDSDIYGSRYWGFFCGCPIYIEVNVWMFGEIYTVYWLDGKPNDS